MLLKVRIIIFFTSTLLFSVTIAQVGFVDPNFGSNGIANPQITGDEAGVNHYAYGDGKILQLCNFYKNGMTAGILLIKYNSDGSLDNSFGVNGVIRDSIADFFIMWGQELSVLDDGTFLVSGGMIGNESKYLLMKYNDDGSRHETFGQNGVANYSFPFSYAFGYGMAVQPDGKIIVTGNDYGNFTVLRFNADGSLDNSFGNQGGIAFDFPATGSDFSYTAELLSDDRIIVSGHVSASDDIPALACITPSGELDTSFGNEGMVLLSQYPAQAHGLCIQPDDKILLSGDNFCFRLNSEGMLDDSFGNSGVVDYGIPPGYDYINLLTICTQEDGKIVVAGEAGHNSGYTSDLLLVRLTSNGQIDSDFGTSGIGEFIQLSPTNNTANHVSIQNDNKLLVSGGLLFSDNTQQIILARYQNDVVSSVGGLYPSGTLTVFPNPARDVLCIENIDGSIGRIEIYNGGGTRVMSLDEPGSHTKIYVGRLPNGTYVIRPMQHFGLKPAVFIMQ
ncbi:MAG: T9SS type A sorting domain-containing protein [Bacteroidales bacterium]